ncbi:hypothetical protein KIW84_070748 [Lathyrus oleraceus]|uniref:Retrovirus-related Pol polyprotein from transposon TNT 1-94 n=1 Tax=Pisum sativum TaxID=3888 RepID=A0A9D4ZU03_PEA|nr:hypothetical protein KIW84_070748 [Pisum sativum]
MATFEKFVTPRFDGHYDHWSMLMENFLRSKEMWNLVDEGVPAPAIGNSSAKQRMQGSQGEEQALRISYDDKPRRGRGSFRGGRGRGRGRSSMNKATVQFFKCHQLGHFQYECPDWEKNANYAEHVEE